MTRPLIATLLAHLDGQTTREAALQAYREAENRHGIHIHDDHDARVAPGAFKPHMPISEERVRTLTRSWEQFDRALEPLGRAAERELVIRTLGPFISDTGLWMAGADLAEDHLFIFRSGEVGSWTAEQWDHHLANWAAVAQYQGRDDWTAERVVDQVRRAPRYAEWTALLRSLITEARGGPVRA
ncbi:MAG TPA: hypothetical protein VLS88_00855 [Polyangiales bacterium]|nr:hypothetical protein [Polyangiales bacterium]